MQQLVSERVGDAGLTELQLEPPGPRRLVHSLAYQAPLRFASRACEVGLEVTMARFADVAIAHRLRHPQILRSEAGGAPAATGGRRVALYSHYAAAGRISPMVREQVAGYRALGFDVVFATNSKRLDEASWRDVAPHCWHMIWRRNVGFDFGAWRDSAAMLLAGRPPEELLLVNDSVLGPISPLAPLLHRARMFGSGAVGLTEGWQGGVHLQSYFVLVIGTAAVSDTLTFLLQLRLSTSKWLIVQRGEFGLTRHLVRRGHRVAGLFGYMHALDTVLACPEERRYLASLAPQLAHDAETSTSMRAALIKWPINPTTHFWRSLPRSLNFPFVKVALIRQNVGRLPGVSAWPILFERVPLALDLARDHLAAL